MLHFIYGCPGSGKTACLNQRIKERLSMGKKALLIVPERFCVSAEKEICRSMETGNRLNLDILSFKRLCNAVFRVYGGLSYNYLGKGGRTLMMWKALESVKGDLEACSSIRLSDISTVEAMLDSVISFERGFFTREYILEIAESKELENAKELSKKLRDLVKIWEEYEKNLKNKYDDPEEDLTRLYSVLESHPEFLREREIFIDSTTAFSGQELAIVRLMLRESPHVTVTIPKLPQDHRMMQAKIDWCEVQLRNLSTEENVETEENYTVLNTPILKKSEDLLHIEKEIFGNEAPFEKKSEHILLNSAETPYDECVKVSSDILENVISEGGRFMDHAVAVRNLESYKGLIDHIFKENNIPYIMTDSEPLFDTAAFRLILTALRLQNNNFRLEDLFSYIRTGYTDLEGEEEFLLEDYANLWGIEGKRWISDTPFRMNPQGRSAERTPEGEEKLAKINMAKDKIMAPLSALFEDMEGGNVRSIATALYDFMVKMELDEKLENQAKAAEEKGRPEDAQKYRQIFKELVDLLDELVFTLGDTVPKKEELSLFLEVLAKNREMGSIPGGVDRVLISDTFNLKPNGVKRLHLLGVNDGVFPAPISTSGLFRFKDLEQLKKAGMDLPGDRFRKVLDEEYICYSAATLPYEELSLSYYKKDLKGASTRPSEFYEVIASMFENRREKKNTLPYGKSNLFEYALSEEKQGEAVLSYLEKQKVAFLENIRKFREEDQNIRFSKEFLDLFYNNKSLTLSQSKLETFVNCPFHYSCSYILKIRDLPSTEIQVNEVGTLVHLMLESLITKSIREKKPFGEWSNEKLEEEIEAIRKKVEKNIIGDETEDVMTAELLRRVTVGVKVYAENIRDEFSESDFKPVFCELSFGQGKKEGAISLPPVKIPGEVPVNLTGIADRVDAFKKGNNIYLMVVDYKTGEKNFYLEDLDKGLNVQMPIYLKALKETHSEDFKKALGMEEGDEICPAGCYYHIVKYPKFTPKERTGELEEKIRQGIKRSGWLLNDEDILKSLGTVKIETKKNSKSTPEEMDEKLEELQQTLEIKAQEILSGKSEATPRKKKGSYNGCAYCQMGPICRKKLIEEEDGEDDED